MSYSKKVLMKVQSYFSGIFFKMLALLVVLSASIWLCFICAETYFFDSLIYKKSCFHGYEISGSWWCQIVIQERRNDIEKLAQAVEADSPIPKKNKRLVLIGDSYFYGQGLRYGRTVSEKLARKYANLGWEVWNLSAVGDDLIDNYTKYLSARKYLQPDYIVIELLDNDLITVSDSEPKYERLKNQAIQKNLLANCNQPLFSIEVQEMADIFALSWDVQVKKLYQEPLSSKYATRCILKQIANEIGSNEDVVWFEVSESEQYSWCPNSETRVPSSDDFQVTHFDVRQILTDSHNTVVRNLDEGKNTFQTISQIEKHPSVQTHQWYATVIERVLSLDALQ